MGLKPHGLRLELQGNGQEGGYHSCTGPADTGITLQLASSTNRMNLAVGTCHVFPSILHLDLSETWGFGGEVTCVGKPWSHSHVAASESVNGPES